MSSPYSGATPVGSSGQDPYGQGAQDPYAQANYAVSPDEAYGPHSGTVGTPTTAEGRPDPPGPVGTSENTPPAAGKRRRSRAGDARVLDLSSSSVCLGPREEGDQPGQ